MRFNAQFLTIFLKKTLKCFCRPYYWVYNIIIYTRICEHCCAYKVSHKFSSNYYHFFNIAIFVFESRVFFAIFSVCQTMYVPGTS